MEHLQIKHGEEQFRFQPGFDLLQFYHDPFIFLMWFLSVYLRRNMLELNSLWLDNILRF